MSQIALCLEIVFLQRAVLGRAGDERGFQSELLRRLQIVIVRGDHNHLFRRQAQQARGPR